jgi:hypothetical protein
MIRRAAVTVRRPGLSTVPATSTRTWPRRHELNTPENGRIHSAKIRGTVGTMVYRSALRVDHPRAT